MGMTIGVEIEGERQGGIETEEGVVVGIVDVLGYVEIGVVVEFVVLVDAM